MIARAIDSLSERISPRVLFPNTFLTNCDFLIQFDDDDGEMMMVVMMIILTIGISNSIVRFNIFWTNTSTDLYSSNHEDNDEIKLKICLSSKL